MSKTRITADQYLEELNRHLREDKAFEDGMEFLPSPPGSSGAEMSGYSMTGRFTNWHWIGVYARVAHKVEEKYET